MANALDFSLEPQNTNQVKSDYNVYDDNAYWDKYIGLPEEEQAALLNQLPVENVQWGDSMVQLPSRSTASIQAAQGRYDERLKYENDPFSSYVPYGMNFKAMGKGSGRPLLAENPIPGTPFGGQYSSFYVPGFQPAGLNSYLSQNGGDVQSLLQLYAQDQEGTGYRGYTAAQENLPRYSAPKIKSIIESPYSAGLIIGYEEGVPVYSGSTGQRPREYQYINATVGKDGNLSFMRYTPPPPSDERGLFDTFVDAGLNVMTGGAYDAVYHGDPGHLWDTILPPELGAFRRFRDTEGGGWERSAAALDRYIDPGGLVDYSLRSTGDVIHASNWEMAPMLPAIGAVVGGLVGGVASYGNPLGAVGGATAGQAIGNKLAGGYHDTDYLGDFVDAGVTFAAGAATAGLAPYIGGAASSVTTAAGLGALSTGAQQAVGMVGAGMAGGAVSGGASALQSGDANDIWKGAVVGGVSAGVGGGLNSAIGGTAGKFAGTIGSALAGTGTRYALNALVPGEESEMSLPSVLPTSEETSSSLLKDFSSWMGRRSTNEQRRLFGAEAGPMDSLFYNINKRKLSTALLDQGGA